MIRFFVVLDGIRRNVISLHHLLVGVTGFAGLVIKLPCLQKIRLARCMVRLCVVQTMTVAAGSRILIALHDGGAVTGQQHTRHSCGILCSFL